MMLGSNITLLEEFITKASGWRATGQTVNTDLRQLIAVFPDGGQVTLTWDDTANDGGGDWRITT